MAFAGCNAFEFLNVMPAGTVIGVFGKDNCRALFGCVEITMGFLQLVGEPIVTRSGADPLKAAGVMLSGVYARPSVPRVRQKALG